MSEPYSIYELDEHREALETRGSKEKFWLRHPTLGRCLFKFPRSNSGEDWSERIAASAAAALGLPHAKYELALIRAAAEMHPGVLSVDFLADEEMLVSGHSLLMAHTHQYPTPDRIPRFDSKIKEYTVHSVLDSIRSAGLEPVPDFESGGIGNLSALDLFVGYLVLDALIGNQDRHHENWGAVEFNK